MQLTVTGKQLEFGEAFLQHVKTSLPPILEKYFRTGLEAPVVMAREAHLNQAELSLQISCGIAAKAGAAASDLECIFAITQLIVEQLRDDRTRVRPPGEEATRAVAVSFPTKEDKEMNAGSGPAVFAEISAEPCSLTRGERAMRTDWAGLRCCSPATVCMVSSTSPIHALAATSAGSIPTSVRDDGRRRAEADWAA
jgi:ribosome-associated translation inhibitor RaiA